MSDQIIPRDFYVYAHKRATTGERFYIGKGNGRRAYDKQSRSQYWKHIVNKHGYTVEIVQDGLQEWAAFELESNLIVLYGRKDCKLGPLINGTDGFDGKSGAIASAETRKKLSQANKEKWTKIDYRSKISASLKEANLKPENIQKRREIMSKRWQDDAYIESMSAQRKEMWSDPEFKQKRMQAFKAAFAKPGVLEKRHEAVRAALAKPEARANMSAASKKKWATEEHKAKMRAAMKVAMDQPEYKLKVSESVKERWQDEDYRAKMMPKMQALIDKTKKPVTCVETGKVFDSVSDAARYLKDNGFPSASNSRLCTCCLGKQKTAYGYTWRFLNDTLENQERRAETLARVAKSEAANRKAVLCVSTGQVFQSAAAVEKHLRANGFPKASNACISAACLGKTKHSYGFTWAFAS